MKTICFSGVLVIVMSSASAFAETALNGGVAFDLAADHWGNGLPGPGNPGFIRSDYTNGGNVDMSPVGTASVTQESGHGSGGQWNYHSNPNYTFHLNGGTLENKTGAFFVNGNTFHLSGGSLRASDLRLQNSGTLAIDGGSITTDRFLVRGGSVTMTGGNFTSTSADIIFNRNSGSANSTIDLSGGALFASDAHSLLNNSQLTVTIGGSFTANLPGVTNLFNGGNHAGSSSINFTSDWTGSLTLDSATAWAGVFEAGDVSINGVELGSGDFDTYFQNNSGTISLLGGRLHPSSSPRSRRLRESSPPTTPEPPFRGSSTRTGAAITRGASCSICPKPRAAATGSPDSPFTRTAIRRSPTTLSRSGFSKAPARTGTAAPATTG